MRRAMHHPVPRPEYVCGIAWGVLQLFQWYSRQDYQHIFANITVAPVNTILLIVYLMSYSEGQQGTVIQRSGLTACKVIATSLLTPLGKSNEKWQHSCHWEKRFPRVVPLFSSQRKLRENFGWSANLRARDRPGEFLEIASEAGSKTEELMRLILLKSSIADKN